MKKMFAVLIIIFVPTKVLAGRGCCSHHGGVAGCNSYGRQVCADGTLSPSCTCAPPKIYGCTDSSAYNYNSRANQDDGSCRYSGCTDKNAKNYDPKASKNDGSCSYYVYGCTDTEAKNFDSMADKDDGSCTYYTYGCTSIDAENYDPSAEKDDGSCIYKEKIIDNDIDNENEEDGMILPIVLFTGTSIGGTYAYMRNKREKNKYN